MFRAKTGDALVARYLRRVDAALGSLGPGRRSQIVDEVAEHIADERSRLAPDDMAGLEALLYRMGTPDAIAAAAGVGEHQGRSASASAEAWIPWLLLFGGFAVGIGWLVGVVWLWMSSTWRLGDKILGTLVLPGGLAAVGALSALPGSITECSAKTCVTTGYSLPVPWGLLVLAVAVAAPIVMAVHLERERRMAW